MNKNNIKQKVFEYVDGHEETSFVEIERIFDEHDFDYEGDLSLTGTNNKTLIFWIDWNNEAIEIITELMAEEKIYMDACQPLYYIIDGKGIDLPIPKRAGTKKPHWLPVAFSTSKPILN
ncbi:pathogenicity island protein [Staphylococcus equorum]|uniref:pathogenicity island protein n=1 Tax=Staphylococcus equorum TaxID=246432 RepID=UPI002552756B|nr:pathogenicity island protein [Staphylococcus equorum]MDK9854348.1 pathogenicity island protein [Staphylococcus equorum]